MIRTLIFCVYTVAWLAASSYVMAQSPQLSTGVIEGVGSDWRVVTLNEFYDEMVVVAAPQYRDDQPPAVVRIRNANLNSFEVKVQNPSDESLNNYVVHYVVVESGAYREEEHGVNMEAFTVESTVTDQARDFNGQLVEYVNEYENPVVVGQVMSYNDERWSVFWARGLVSVIPPSTLLYVGKHVGEDDEGSRENEQLGYIVIESGIGEIPGFAYEALVTEDVVVGIQSAPPYEYEYGLKEVEAVVVSAAGMDGNNGGWPVVSSDGSIGEIVEIVFDEDQISDPEREHTNEQVAILLIDQVQPPPQIDTFAPNSGRIGSKVTLTGRNFLDIQAVLFDESEAASFDVLSEDTIIATVPEGASSGEIRVLNEAGEATTQGRFDVISGTLVSEMSPTRGEEGDVIQISGGSLQFVTRIEFEGGVEAEYELISDSELRIRVPSGASTGYIRIFDDTNIELLSPEVFVLTFGTASPGINLCRLTSAEASQSSFAALSTEAFKACDGILSGSLIDQSVAATTVEEEAWWEVDLGAIYEIDEILFTNGTDCCPSENGDFFVFVSDGPFVSRSVSLTLADPLVSTYFVRDQEVASPIKVGRTGGFIRLQYLYEGSFNLAEVEVVAATGNVVNVSTESAEPMNEAIELYPAYPSPAIDHSILSYKITEGAPVRLSVHDVLGREIKVLVDVVQAPGNYRVPFNMSDLSPGLYIYRLSVSQRTLERSVIRVR